MRITGRVIGFVMLATAATAEAQSCLGMPSFSHAPLRVSGSQLFPEGNASAYAASVGAGRPDNVFLNLGYGRVTHDDADLFPEDRPTEQQALFELGYQIPLWKHRIQLCPVGGAGLGRGPVIDGIDYRRKFASAGLAAGFGVNIGFGIRVVPNASLRWEYLRTTGEGVTEAFSNGIADVGLGVMFARRIVIQPTYSMPFATGTPEDAMMGVVVSVGLGRRSP